MNKILAGVVALAAIASITAPARAEKVCQWTGSDWACGDGNSTFPQHYSEATGPQTVIVPVTTVTPTGQPAHQFNSPRPY